MRYVVSTSSMILLFEQRIAAGDLNYIYPLRPTFGICRTHTRIIQPSLRSVAPRFYCEITMAYFCQTLMLYYPGKLGWNFCIYIFLKRFINLELGHIYFDSRVCEVNNTWENWDWIFMQVQFFSNIKCSIDFILKPY